MSEALEHTEYSHGQFIWLDSKPLAIPWYMYEWKVCKALELS